MTNTIIDILFIVFGAFICLRRKWVADRLQRFYSTYPLIRLAGQDQLRSRGGFVVVFGLLLAGIGIVAIAEQWIF